MSSFNWSLLSKQDRARAWDILHNVRLPDLDIEPDGTPYLYRWHVIPRNPAANVYLHVQVASDPERPLHDHPWDNQSVILAGGYLEVYEVSPPLCSRRNRRVWQGDVVTRKAEEAHRLILPEGVPYTMTLFTTGPVRRDWGFWIPRHVGIDAWARHEDCITIEGKRSFFHIPNEV